MKLRQLSAEDSAAADVQLQKLLREGKQHLRDLAADEAKALLTRLAAPASERRTVSGVRFPDRLEVHLSGLRDIDFADCDLTNIRIKGQRFGKEFTLEGCTFDGCVWENPLLDHWVVRDTSFRKTVFTKVLKGWFDSVSFERCLFEDCVLPGTIKECTLRDVELRARGAMETGFRDCRIERVRIVGHFAGRFQDCICRPLDIGDADVVGTAFDQIHGVIHVPQAFGNCVVPGTVFAQVRDELLPQLSIDGRSLWDRNFNAAWKWEEYLSVGGTMLKPFTVPDREVVQTVLYEHSVAEIRAD